EGIEGVAEIMSERSNKSEPAAGFRNARIARRPTGPIIDLVKPITFGQPRAHERQRQILIEPAFAYFAERHYFDQRQIHAAGMGPFEQAWKLVFVDVLERHCVDLDLEAGGL